MLRADTLQVLQLKVTIGNLVMTMIEENSVESLVVAKVRHLRCCLMPTVDRLISIYSRFNRHFSGIPVLVINWLPKLQKLLFS